MAIDLPLRCTCAQVRGVARDVSSRAGNRVVCYCADCRAFARFLERTDVTDSAGGTDIFQMAPSRLEISEGKGAVRCMRLSEKGLYRWYAGCCKTPIGNTLGGRFPFVGLILAFRDTEADRRSCEEVLGEPLAFIHGRAARVVVPPHVHPTAPLAVVARAARLVGGWWLGGKSAPSPFFDPKTRAPIVTPRVLRDDERAAVRD